MSYPFDYCHSKDRKAVPYSNLAIYDVIIAVKPQDLDLRNQINPCGCESGHATIEIYVHPLTSQYWMKCFILSLNLLCGEYTCSLVPSPTCTFHISSLLAWYFFSRA